MKYVIAAFVFFSSISVHAQNKDTTDIDKLRTESGVDPTRVQSRVGYSIMAFNQKGSAAQVNNRFNLNVAVSRWSLAVRTEVVSIFDGKPGSTFKTGMGDIRFSVLNAFYVRGRSAMAASVEFFTPTGKPGYGTGYFSALPAITYSYTIDPSLIIAVQPQYNFHLFKDPAFPNLSVLTIRSFLAKFTKSGYFLVFEPRPVFDLANKTTDLVLSPIIGKSLGAGFNLILLGEFAVTKNFRNTRGQLVQFGFNKNF